MHTKGYELHANRLMLSALRTGITLIDHSIPQSKNWCRTTHRKAEVILASLNKFDGGILWIDADSEFKQYPILLHRLPENVSVAAFNHDGFIWGCVIWWRNDAASRDILARWSAQNETTPQYSGDNNLWHILDEGKHPAYGTLPQEYCSCVRPDRWGLPEVTDPVISHLGTFHGPGKYAGIRHPLVRES